MGLAVETGSMISNEINNDADSMKGSEINSMISSEISSETW